jgi:hypothetical protein
MTDRRWPDHARPGYTVRREQLVRRVLTAFAGLVVLLMVVVTLPLLIWLAGGAPLGAGR